jgi:alcohol dehydrogenase class IV
MDCAKAMLHFAGGDIRLVAIPTTSGSGSEVTGFAILTHQSVKHPLIDQRLRPEMAILDEDLLTGLPPSLVADGGFDVLSHALEAFVAQDASPFTDALARDAFCCAFGALPASFAGQLTVRGKVHTAATMAGMAFTQAGLGVCHALSHSLGGMFHIPHGRLNAILLPSVVSLNAAAAGEKYAKLARAAGLGGSVDTIAVRNLKNGLIRLRRELKLPETLAQAGVQPRDVWRRADEIVAAALNDPCCRTNPVKVEDFMLRQMLEEVTGRV